MLKRFVWLACASLVAAMSGRAQDYKLETIDTPPPALPAAYASVIYQHPGLRVVGPAGAWCEIWFRDSIPTGPKPTDSSVTLPIPQGTLLGILRFPAQGMDRRGQPIPAGVYTLRYSNDPVDGAHQGVAPQRDFALLTPIANDADPNSAPGFSALVQMSAKASGTPHPAVLSLETPADAKFPALTKEGDHDWVVNVKLGDLPLAMIVAGKYEG
ncbi:MAG: hypothetical protein ABSC23_10310 [Bryobacteraceae bacterium]|jgi:hypothetical protein